MKHFITYQMKLLELVCDKLEIDYSEHKKKAWAINQKKYEEYQKQYVQEKIPTVRKPYGMSDEEFERLLNITEDEYIDLQGSYVVACRAYDQKLSAIAEYQYEGEESPNPLVLKQLMDEKRKLWKVKDNLSDSLTVADDNRKLKEELKKAQ